MKETLKSLAVTIGSCVTIFTGVWFFGEPALNQHVNDLVKEYVNSDAYEIQEREIAKDVSKEIFQEFLASKVFEERLDEYLNRANANKISLRKILSIKMGVPQESVADRLSDLYTKDAKRLRNLLRGINNMYPELNVWEIQED